jgi:hypothetical protein
MNGSKVRSSGKEADMRKMNIRIGNYVDGKYSPVTKDDDEPADKKLSEQLDEIVAEMVAATGGDLHPDRARRWLLHTSQGQNLLLQRKKEQTPMLDINQQIAKLLEITEIGLNAQVTKRDGESFAKAFSRKYESDESYRRQWRDHSEAKLAMTTLTPTSVAVGNPNVADDSAEAVRLLSEMATKNGRSFEQVFADPANAKLAAQTYTSAHGTSAS